MLTMKTSLFILLILALLAPQTDLRSSDVAKSAHKPGDIIIEKATITAHNGQTIRLDLGTLFVPENRRDAKSRIIGVGFARVPALRPTNAPPTFHFPGGPGGSFLNGLKPGDNGKK
jgi:hypothetical protein